MEEIKYKRIEPFECEPGDYPIKNDNGEILGLKRIRKMTLEEFKEEYPEVKLKE